MTGPPAVPSLASLSAPRSRSRAALGDAWAMWARPGALAYEAELDGRLVVGWPGALDAPLAVDGRAFGAPGALGLGGRGWARDVRTGGERGAQFACATASGPRGPRGRPILHRRSLCLFEEGALAVVDELVARGEVALELRLPLGARLDAQASGAVARVRAGAAAFAAAATAGTWSVAAADAQGRATLVLVVPRLSLPARVVHAWVTGRDVPAVSARPAPGAEVGVEVGLPGATLRCHLPRFEAP